jgi:hypothetical protein
VSVQRILQVAEVKSQKDSSWAKTASDASTDIKLLMEDAQERRRVTAVDVICQKSNAMRIVLFLGGLYEFPNRGIDAMYARSRSPRALARSSHSAHAPLRMSCATL